MKNIANIRNCYGCGVCSVVCAQKIIDISLNGDGFYAPKISNLAKCTDCGLCLEVCAFSHEELSLSNDSENSSWAAWSRDERVVRKCSSGGIGFEIAKQLIEKEYKVCGCRYNAELDRAEHYIATTVEEAIPSIGSKYIQSFTVDAFKSIKRKEKYLVTGTPCQIDSFRRYIRKFRIEDNFVLLDFFCHCVPSMWAWKKYTHMVEKKLGKITYASWRNKLTGWHDSWAMALDGVNTDSERNDKSDSYDSLMMEKNTFYHSRLSQGDVFYTLFLGDYCCNPACAKNCKYKYNRSSADVRIGDLWGNTYKDNDQGVSALVAFTEKGKSVVKSLRNVTLIEHPFEVVAEGQMTRNVHMKPTYNLVMRFLKSPFGLDSFVWKIVYIFSKIYTKLYYKLKR